MMHPVRALPRLLAVLAAALLAGCAQTPDDRIKDNQGLFDTYSPSDRALIRAGRIQTGFDKAQVSMALGAPDQTRGAGGAEEWLYVQHEYRTIERNKDVYQYALEMKEYDEAVKRGEEVDEPTITVEVRQKRTRITQIVHFRDGRVESHEQPIEAALDDWRDT